MNLNRVLRPALKILTTTLVTVVTVAGVTSGPSTATAAPAKASSVKLVAGQSVFPAYSDAYYAGETLGRGAITPKTLVTMWMHSAPHRHVLMSKSPTRIGIGATPNAHGEWVVAANFMRF
jgi:cysteine-rich secretory family protein